MTGHPVILLGKFMCFVAQCHWLLMLPLKYNINVMEKCTYPHTWNPMVTRVWRKLLSLVDHAPVTPWNSEWFSEVKFGGMTPVISCALCFVQTCHLMHPYHNFVEYGEGRDIISRCALAYVDLPISLGCLFLRRFLFMLIVVIILIHA